MKKNKTSKNWLRKQNKNQFFKLSKIQGYRSRSAYKLIEINNKYKFLKKKSSLLDLGASPGGWCQVARKEIVEGKILGIDLNPMIEINKVDFIKGDFTNDEISNKIYKHFNNKIDVVLSDIAANTSGNKSLDSYRTGELCLKAMELSTEILKNDGVFLSKLFMGSIFKEIDQYAKMKFKKVIKIKPLSSKKESKEIYIFCKGILNL